jgi:pimeloyl-ACP methyl ester carboxylesterase
MVIRRKLARIIAWATGPTLPAETDAIIQDVLNTPLPEMVHGRSDFTTSEGLRIWFESISPQAPPQASVLLIMSMAGDALMWPPKFVQTFVDAGYHVIRYDHRGTGLSDWVEHWDRKRPYAIADMARDTVAVLDAAGVQRAHMVGLSMGGMVAQEVAIQAPGRVASLTLMMTSGFIGDPDLPGLTSRYFLEGLVKGLPMLKYRLVGGEKNLIKERIAKQISAIGHDGLDIREIAEVFLYDLRRHRGMNVRAMLQHQAAVTVAGSRHEKLQALSMPALVIHGTADQLIPVEHGRKLVASMPKAEGLWLEGVGHVFPLPNMNQLNTKILQHIKAASSPSPDDPTDRLAR